MSQSNLQKEARRNNIRQVEPHAQGASASYIMASKGQAHVCMAPYGKAGQTDLALMANMALNCPSLKV